MERDSFASWSLSQQRVLPYARWWHVRHRNRPRRAKRMAHRAPHPGHMNQTRVPPKVQGVLVRETTSWTSNRGPLRLWTEYLRVTASGCSEATSVVIDVSPSQVTVADLPGWRHPSRVRIRTSKLGTPSVVIRVTVIPQRPDPIPPWLLPAQLPALISSQGRPVLMISVNLLAPCSPRARAVPRSLAAARR